MEKVQKYIPRNKLLKMNFSVFGKQNHCVYEAISLYLSSKRGVSILSKTGVFAKQIIV